MVMIQGEYQPIVERTEQQLRPPKRIEDSMTGIVYDAHLYNEGASDVPAVLYLGLGSTATNASGRAFIDACVTECTEREFIVLGPDRYAGSLQATARADLRALDMLGVDKFDAIGMSLGGVLSSSVAAMAGVRTRSLVTVSSVGTKRGYSEYTLAIPRQLASLDTTPTIRQKQSIGQRLGEVCAMLDFLDPRTPERLKKVGAAVRLAVNASLSAAASELHPQTNWTDIVGAKDRLTHFADHLRIVRDRNLHHPRSSSIHVLSHKSHLWGDDRGELAQYIHRGLTRATPTSTNVHIPLVA